MILKVFCHFELDKIITVDPAINSFYDFDCFCHFELEQIIKVDPAITFFNDFDRFCNFEIQKVRSLPRDKESSRGHLALQSTDPLAQVRTPKGKALFGQLFAN